MSRIVAAMRRQGLVTVTPHPTDRRSRVVDLTDAGRTAFAVGQAVFLDLLSELQDELGDSAPLIAWGVRRLEAALRTVGGAARVAPLPEPGRHATFYAGERLRPEQEAELLSYLEWLRHRDAGSR